MVTLEKLSGPEDAKALQAIIYQHLEATESKKAKEILAKWDEYAPKFKKVLPRPPVAALPSVQAATTPVATKS